MTAPIPPAGSRPAAAEAGDRKAATPVQELESVTIRFCGDSGDGMQLAGTQFTNTSAILGNDVATFPDFPAEIRAPAGTLAGVSGFQVHFSSQRHPHPRRHARLPRRHEPGRPQDQPPRPPARRHPGRQHRRVRRPGPATRPSTRSTRSKTARSSGYRVDPGADHEAEPRGRRRRRGCPPATPTAARTSSRLGLVYWMYERPLDPTLKWIKDEVRQEAGRASRPTRSTLKAGYNYGETVELLPVQYRVPKAKMPPGTYRKITGNEARRLGLVAATAARRRGRSSTPATRSRRPATSCTRSPT